MLTLSNQSRAKIILDDIEWAQVKKKLLRLDAIEQAKSEIYDCKVKDGQVWIYTRRNALGSILKIQNNLNIKFCHVEGKELYLIGETVAEPKKVSRLQWFLMGAGTGSLGSVLLFVIILL